MNPEAWLDASVAVATVALALSGAAIWAARGVAPPDGRELASLVGRLVEARNASRAYKLCRAAPRMAALAGVRAMLDAASGRSAEPGAEAGYRDGSPLPDDALRQRLRAAFDAAARGPLRALTASSTLSLLGLVAAVYALELGLAGGGAQRVEWAGALVATLGAQAWGLGTRRSARRHTRQAREGLVEPMSRAWRAGALVDGGAAEPAGADLCIEDPDMAP